MNSIEVELFDEFKRVDSICRDMFHAEKGVTAYIEQMEMTPLSVKYLIPRWEDDYKQLKHIRWGRNQIAHESGYVECTASDVNWLKAFHKRLLNCQDPLAKAEQIERLNKQRVAQPQSKRENHPIPSNNKPPQKSNSALWKALAVAGVAAAIVIGVVLLFLKIN